MRAVVYARYSSDAQRAASIEDQLEVCRRFLTERGWTLVKVYEDRATSGASRFRSGYQQLLADLDRRRLEVVVVEALDRLGRKLADVADLHDRLSFAGIKLYAVATGEITAMHIGLLGTMAQLQLADLREKTWRGQLGRALQGKLPGGRAYGYDVVEPAATRERKAERGERRIDPAEAAVVVRIFEMFAAGTSPRAIAKSLNAKGVPGPDGRAWRDTTIRGQVDRGTGILNNAIYAGQLEWNRCAYVKNPRTGKRVARPNPRDKWETTAVPELRIVSDALWEAVKARQAEVRIEIGRDEHGNALNRAHRRQFLLSGLLICGTCGGGFTIIGKDRYGCATRKAKGTCSNALTIKRQVIEARVLAGLKEKLLARELVETFIEEFQAEVNRAARTAQQEAEGRRRELEGIERKIAGILRAIEDGNYNPTLTRRLSELEQQKATIETALTEIMAPPALWLPPDLVEIYREKVARLEAALNAEDTKTEAAELLRGLIDRVVLTPTDTGLQIQLHGQLVQLLRAAESSAAPVCSIHDQPLPLRSNRPVAALPPVAI